MELTLNFCENMFGYIKPEISEKLKKVIENPTQKTWDNAYSIIISKNKGFTTLWQAVIKIDPSFQKKGKIDPSTGETKWDKIPSSEIIKEAIQREVFNFELN